MPETQRDTSRSSTPVHSTSRETFDPPPHAVVPSSPMAGSWAESMSWPAPYGCAVEYSVPSGSFAASRGFVSPGYGAVQPLAQAPAPYGGPVDHDSNWGNGMQSPCGDANLDPASPASPFAHAMPPPYSHAMPAPYSQAMPAPYSHAMPAPYSHAMPAPYSHAMPAPYSQAMPAPYSHAMPAPYGLGDPRPSAYLGHAPGALGAPPEAMGMPAPYAGAGGNPAFVPHSQPAHFGAMAGGHSVHQRAPQSVTPYGGASHSPAQFAANAAPYGAQSAMAAPYARRDLGWSMWRFDGEQWDLIEDCSVAEAEACTPERQRGRFVGQVVRTPSVLADRRPEAVQPGSFSKSQVDDFVQRAANVPGYASESELRWFAGAASSLEPGATWVEIGAMCGRSFLAVGLSLPKGATLISIDTSMGLQKRQGITLLDTYEELARERRDLQITLMRCPSVQASRLIREKSCDVVYIDGDHSGPAVQADVLAWTPNLVESGLMCGHDYGEPEFPGVKAVVDCLPHSTVAVGSIWVWHP